MIKIGKYIFVIVPLFSIDFDLGLPYNNNIWFHIENNNMKIWIEVQIIECKYLKPNTGIRYKIKGKFGIILIIEQLKKLK